MDHWAMEFSRDYEIPDFIQFLVSKKVIEDLSWHNDSAPSFGVFSEGGEKGVQLWVGHPFVSRRDHEGERFGITISSAGHLEDIFAGTDDLDEALEHLFKQLAAFHSGLPAGAFEWRPKDSLVESPWNDPLSYLQDLKNEYLETFRR